MKKTNLILSFILISTIVLPVYAVDDGETKFIIQQDVGIKIKNPTATLHLNGTGLFEDGAVTFSNTSPVTFNSLALVNNNLQIPTGAAPGFILTSNATGIASWTNPSAISSNGDNLGNHTATTNLDMATSDIINAGKIGINTANPMANIQIRSDDLINGGILVGANISQPALYGIIRGPGKNTGISPQDSFRMLFDRTSLNPMDANDDYLIFDKTDGNEPDPDGGIAFTNTGNDGVREVSLSIKGNGFVGLGVVNQTAKLDVGGGVRNFTDGIDDLLVRDDIEADGTIYAEKISINVSSPTADLEILSNDLNNGGIMIRTHTNTNQFPILRGPVNAYGIPNQDSFRISQAWDYLGPNNDYLIFDKTDGNHPDPDGGIVFTNTGSDGIQEVSLAINGDGFIGIGTNAQRAKLDVGGGVRNFIDGIDDLLVRDDVEVDGTIYTSGFRMTTGAGNDLVLSSDAAGNAIWKSIGAISGTGDNLGNHTATTNLNMATRNIVNAGTITATNFSGSGGGIINLNGANLSMGIIPIGRIPNIPASKIIGGTGDNLGNHLATQTLDMDNQDIKDAKNINASNILTNNTSPGAIATRLYAQIPSSTGWADFATISRQTVGSPLLVKWAVGSTGDTRSEGGANTFYIHQKTNKDDVSVNGYRLAIDDTGLVGIGLHNPKAKLDVGGGVRNFIDGIDDLLVKDDVEVDGTFFTSGFRMPTGAGNNLVLTSDASGNATWKSLTALPSNGDNFGNHTATQTLDMDNQDIKDAKNINASNILTNNTSPGAIATRLYAQIPSSTGWADFVTISRQTAGSPLLVKWAVGSTGDTRSEGGANTFYIHQKTNKNDVSVNGYRLAIDDTGLVGIGLHNPKAKLDVGGGVRNFIDGVDDLLVKDDVEVDGIIFTSGFRMPTGAGNNLVLTSDATGNATWKSIGAIGGAGDDLGNHTATSNLNMATRNITNAGTITATSFSGSGASITNINAANISSGILNTARIPNLNASQITTGTFSAARIPDLDASIITSGTFSAARIPDLNASKITGGVFDINRIPNIPASKIIGGVPGDNLGSHQASQHIYMNNNDIINAGDINARRIRLSTGAGLNKVLTSDTSGNATWENPPGSDNLGNHTATRTLNMNTQDIKRAGDINGEALYATKVFARNTASGAYGSRVYAEIPREDGYSEFVTSSRGAGHSVLEKWSVGSTGNSRPTTNGYPNAFFIFQWRNRSNTRVDQYRLHINDAGNVSIGGQNATEKLVVEGNLRVNGNASKPGGGSFSSASDARLKDIHGRYEYGLKEILDLKTVRFSYKKDNPLSLPSNTQEIGFIAQEVQKVIPDAVTLAKDGYFEFNIHPINVAMVNAIKELKVEKDTEIKELKEQVSLLKKLYCIDHPKNELCK